MGMSAAIVAGLFKLVDTLLKPYVDSVQKRKAEIRLIEKAAEQGRLFGDAAPGGECRLSGVWRTHWYYFKEEIGAKQPAWDQVVLEEDPDRAEHYTGVGKSGDGHDYKLEVQLRGDGFVEVLWWDVGNAWFGCAILRPDAKRERMEGRWVGTAPDRKNGPPVRVGPWVWERGEQPMSAWFRSHRENAHDQPWS